MQSRTRTALLAALFAGLSSFANADDGGTPPVPDPVHPAVGEWVGQVSWNDTTIYYAWEISPNGTFSSGRLGRGQSGGGAWSTNGPQLILKYSDGFRYEGELHNNSYDGSVYLDNGRVFGAFFMRRDAK